MFDAAYVPAQNLFSPLEPFGPHAPARVLDSLVLVVPVMLDGQAGRNRTYNVIAAGRNHNDFVGKSLDLHFRKQAWLNEDAPTDPRGILAMIADQRPAQIWHRGCVGQPLIVQLESAVRPDGSSRLRWMKRRPA